MKIAIYGRPTNENLSPQVKQLFAALDKRKASLFVHKGFNEFLAASGAAPAGATPFSTHSDLAGKVDYMLSLGGDGTLLETIDFIRDSGIPILGINTGRLGFLATVSKDEIEFALKAIESKKFTLDKRVLLKLETASNPFGKVNYALNELTIHKKDSSAMMSIQAHLNGDLLNTYWADGLIVSTPTGSTAYSLSCGGPIIVPNCSNFIVNPIAPHNLNVRPIIITDDSVLTLKVEGRSLNFLVSLDSRTATFDTSVELTVKKGDFHINLLKLEGQNFLNTIRNKLMWGLDRRGTNS